MSLQDLATIAETCTACRLHEGRKKVAFGRGPDAAPLMLVGEMPSKLDDESGRPFSGKEGDHLGELLDASRIPRDEVYLANILKCKPQQRFPEDDCPSVCAGYLKKQIELVKPLVIVLMGKQAVNHLLFPGTGLSADLYLQWVGKHLRRRDRFGDIRFAITYHPSFLLKNKSPEDEELTLATLSDAWLFAQARIDGAPAPAISLEDIATTPPPMWQSRSLWRSP